MDERLRRRLEQNLRLAVLRLTRDSGSSTHDLLVERVKGLSEALERLSRGEYGTCAECGGPIARARLRARPEVQTCLRCQDGLARWRVALPAPPVASRLP